MQITSIAEANRLFRNKNYKKSLELYNLLVKDNPEIKKYINANMILAKNKLEGQEENTIENLSESIFVGIAAIPERAESLKLTIDSLLPQVEKIGVYLNNWKSIPDFLIHKKIIIEGYKDKDIGDIGKFYWVEQHNGIYFTCDDDLIYPKDYVVRTLEKLKSMQFDAAIGWHGSLLQEPFEKYYDKLSRRVFVFSAHRPHDTVVHILGTGCCAFHTKKLNIKLSDFKYPNMADIFFAIKGQQVKIPFYVIAHDKNEIIEHKGAAENSIYAHSHKELDSKKNTHELQNEFIKQNEPWVLNHFRPLSILIIGRFENYKKGGIYKSCHLIKIHLENLGHKVETIDTQNELILYNYNKIDLCWIYPGDPERPDFDSVEEKIKILQENQVPVIINLSYLYTEGRTKWISNKIKQLNNKSGSPVLAAVFTESAANDPIFKDVLQYICIVPKTILPTPYNHNFDFCEREGICFGDATKLTNSSIIGGKSYEWIEAVHRRLPHVNLYAYKQYQGENPHPKIQFAPYMKTDFGEWLARRKLFVCINTHLTFEMVACEAQYYGTPVIYRHMPHSLSEYISATGLAVRTPDEMAEMIAWLYNDQKAWSKFNQASIYNAKSNHVELLDASLEGYLRLAIYRALNLSSKNRT